MKCLITLLLLMSVSVLWLGTPVLCAGQGDGEVKQDEKVKKDKKPAGKVEKAEVLPEAAVVELTPEELEDLELFKKLSRPEKRPKVDERRMDAQEKKLSDLIEIYHELGEKLRERKTLSNETDEKIKRKNQRQVGRLDKDIKKLKKGLVKEAQQLRRPLDNKYDDYMKEKEAYDKKIEEAEKSNNERKVEKLAQEFARKGNRIEGIKTQIDCINYYLFWDEFTGK